MSEAAEQRRSNETVNKTLERNGDRSPRWRFILAILRIVIEKSRLAPLLAALLLDAKARRCNEIQDYVNLSYNFHLGFGIFRTGISPTQIKSELVRLARLVNGLKPRVVLEIGTSAGGTFFLWCNLAGKDATLISVDLPGGRFGGGYHEWRIPFFKKMAKGKQTITLLRENSHDPATRGRIVGILNGREIEFLFIDGDHTYEGVRSDFEMYSPLVRKGGIIAFHDIVPRPMATGCKVNEFWNEVKVTHQHLEIVESFSQGWAGLGILFV